MHKADDAVNEALIVANEGKIHRLLAYAAGDGQSQLTVVEEKLLSKVSKILEYWRLSSRLGVMRER